MRPKSHPPFPARLLPRGFRVLRLVAEPRALALHAKPEANSARCPLCGSRS
ncbi:MAG: hypothetical protein M3R38_30420 [Actinomycetota bacterium]|nr:hypothetical protein [Actinomycetota bacterium]